MNIVTQNIINKLASEFNFSVDYFTSLCKSATENIYKKDFEEFINSIAEISTDEDSITEWLLVLANIGILKEWTILKEASENQLNHNELFEIKE